MTPERWQKLSSVLYQALELAPEDRSAFLDRACASDAALRRELESLLSASDEMRSSFLKSSSLAMTIKPGTRLDDYEVETLIGSGGMGEIYRARDTRLKRAVAIKVLPRFVSNDPDRLRRFEQEAQAAAALNHANIVAVFQLGTYQGTPYMVLELLEGQNLRERLRAGPMSPSQVVDYGIQIAHGLAAAHEKGIVHRDLKPENLFLTKGGRVKILDFGLAKLTQDQSAVDSSLPTLTERTEPGMVMGTAGYMAPEQVRGVKADHRTDIFALGAILYEMLTGKRAFQRATSAETMSSILNEEPQRISQIAPHLPAALQRVVQRCLEKNPEQRFQSASDLGFALEAWSDFREAVLPQPKLMKVEVPRNTVRPSLRMGAVAAAVLIAFAAGVWQLIRPALPLHIAEYIQITHKGDIGGLAGTDGSRLFFNIYPWGPVGQVGITGGDIATISAGSNSPIATDVSSDGASLLFWSATGIFSLETAGGPPRFITQRTGVFSPAWSPDATSIAYSDQDGSLYSMKIDGTTDQKLATGDGAISDVAWSPDGNRIRFTRNSELWEISATGENLHLVFPNWQGPEGQCCGRWTRNGNFYVFLAGGNNKNGPNAGGFEQIWALDERHSFFGQASSPPYSLTSGPIHWGTPIPSRDARKIFAVGTTPRAELARFDAQAKRIEPYLSGISAEFLSFSRDGKQITYVTYPDGILWRAKADGSERVQLTTPPLRPAVCRWSPDGTQILFTAKRDSRLAELYTVASRGGSPRQLIPSEEGTGREDAYWSPDGRKIVFAEFEPRASLAILDVASGKVSRIPGSDELFSPRWSPDGRFIAAMTIPATTEIKLFDVQNRQWSTLARHQGTWGFPTWSRDGKFIYALRGPEPWSVDRISVPDGKQERVVDLAGTYLTGATGFWFGLDPNDVPLLLRDNGSSDIYALTLGRK
jgi:serine/threonine protein kinase/Tol biopolymer transport system component